MATEYTWDDLIPPARRRSRGPAVRRMISVTEEVHERVTAYGEKLDLANPDTLTVLLNLADLFDKGEL